MRDIILFSLFFILLFIGYIVVMMAPAIIHKHDEKFLKLYKRWFFLSQGAALLIALFMMTTERNLIPLIGYLLFITAFIFSGTVLLSGCIVPTYERSCRGKKLLKMNYWIFSGVVLLAILWAIIWWKELFN